MALPEERLFACSSTLSVWLDGSTNHESPRQPHDVFQRVLRPGSFHQHRDQSILPTDSLIVPLATPRGNACSYELSSPGAEARIELEIAKNDLSPHARISTKPNNHLHSHFDRVYSNHGGEQDQSTHFEIPHPMVSPPLFGVSISQS